MKDPYKVSQADVDLIKQGICPKCQQSLDSLDEYSYKCSNEECNTFFYLLPEGQGVFQYQCLECQHSMLGITESSYEAMICPNCSNKTLLRIIDTEEL